jgi:hypothetical protein
VEISIEDAFKGTTLSLSLSLPEYDAAGRVRRVPHTVKARGRALARSMASACGCPARAAKA